MNILLIDDSSAILTLIGDYLKKLGHGVLVANSGSDGITMIEHDFPDLVITDLSMPEVDGFEVLEFIYNDNPDLPVIVMSALDNPNDIIRALRAGAWDYVIKPIEPLDIIEFTIERVEKKLELIRKNLEYKNNLEQMVEERTNFLNIVLNSIGDGVISTNKLGDVLYMNPEAVRLLGYSLEEIEGHNLNRYFKIFNSKTSKEEVSIINKVLNGFKEPVRLNNIVLVGRKGDMFQLSSVATALFSEDGTLIGSVLVFRDITDEYELQESLNHKNKMNSMGVLVGGVAHDFNNMLSGIMGCAQLLKAPKRSLTDDNLKFVDMILKSSKQGADLVKKLLIFGHKGKTMFAPVNINSVVDDTVSILNHTLDKRININTDLYFDKLVVNGNSSGIQNMLINLCINASHAMNNTGDINIKTSTIFLDDNFCNKSTFDIKHGEYIEIEVSDSGCGIPLENLKKIFEPFYTTKDKGHGTGLGLATVYGIVLDHLGAIIVSSEKGIGTSFKILLPNSNNMVVKLSESNNIIQGSGLVLYVDDDEVVRESTTITLKDMGFEVLSVEDGLKAIEVFKKRRADISLVLMDINMPYLNGEETYSRLKKIDSSVKVILITGYTDNNEIKKLGINGFLEKPYSNSDLNRMIIDVLEKK